MFAAYLTGLKFSLMILGALTPFAIIGFIVLWVMAKLAGDTKNG